MLHQHDSANTVKKKNYLGFPLFLLSQLLKAGKASSAPGEIEGKLHEVLATCSHTALNHTIEM